MRSRSFLPLTLFLLPALWGPAAAQAAPSITEFPAGSQPRGVALGPDGNVWFTDDGAQAAMGRISPDGVVSMFSAGLDAADKPRRITAGPGGLWFTEERDNKIGRITTDGAISEFGGGTHNKPAGIAAGPDGNLWYTTSGRGGAISRITPTGTVTEFATNTDAQDIARGADGNLWFTTPGSGGIGRITPQGAITEFGAGLLTGTPREIAAGPDGNLWFTQDGVSPSIGRITTTGEITQFSAGLPPSSAPRGIAPGADGNVYFTDSGANAIGKITPSGEITELSSGLTAAADLRGITTGADGRLWFAEPAIAKIGRMTVAPSAGAVTASAVTEAAATVSSAVTPNSETTSYSFEWGTTTDYGQSTANTSAGDGATAQPVGTQLSGLSPGTTYHVRLTATNDAGTSYGPDMSFQTVGRPESPPGRPAPSPAPPTAPAEPLEADANPEAKPVIGRIAVASVTRGTVSVRVPGSATPIELRDGVTIPSGSVLDTRKGTIALESAVDSSGRTQTAKFRGAIFRMELSRRDIGVVDIRLTQAPKGCPSRQFAARAAKASKPIKLWSQDRKGKYRTHGRNSVAIVRGTEWTTAETCAGTLTRVIEGSVSVSNRRTGKKKLVRAGHAYLARSKSARAKR